MITRQQLHRAALVGSLILLGCASATRHGAAQSPPTTMPSLGRTPSVPPGGADSEQRTPIPPSGDFPVLSHEKLAALLAPVSPAGICGEVQIRNMALGCIRSQLQIAGATVLRVNGSPATRLADVRDYLFAWPCSANDATAPIAFVDESLTRTGQALVPTDGIGYRPSEEGLQIHAPQAALSPAKILDLSWPRDAISPSSRISPALSALPRLTPADLPLILSKLEGDEPELGVLLAYREGVRNAEDARYAAALDALHRALSESILNTRHLPATLEELSRGSRMTFINLIPTDSSAPALAVAWDGGQGYRFTLRYPTGLVDDGVSWVVTADPTNVQFQWASVRRYDAVVHRPFHRIAAFNLAETPAQP